jgi:hypothetical protein
MPNVSPTTLLVLATLLTPLPAFAQGGGGGGGSGGGSAGGASAGGRPADPQPVAGALLVRPMLARLVPEQPVSVACPPVRRMPAA